VVAKGSGAAGASDDLIGDLLVEWAWSAIGNGASGYRAGIAVLIEHAVFVVRLMFGVDGPGDSCELARDDHCSFCFGEPTLKVARPQFGEWSRLLRRGNGSQVEQPPSLRITAL